MRESDRAQREELKPSRGAVNQREQVRNPHGSSQPRMMFYSQPFLLGASLEIQLWSRHSEAQSRVSLCVIKDTRHHECSKIFVYSCRKLWKNTLSSGCGKHFAHMFSYSVQFRARWLNIYWIKYFAGKLKVCTSCSLILSKFKQNTTLGKMNT